MRRDCIVDGDGLWAGRERIRIENIDAPEIDQAKCPAERARGIAARDRLLVVLKGGFTIERTGQDRFGRTLARLTVDGVDVGEIMVRGGHARRWTGRRGSWCG